MIKKSGGMGIALDDNAALICIDNTYRVIASQPAAQAYRVYKKHGKVIAERIEPSTQLKPRADLYIKSDR